MRTYDQLHCPICGAELDAGYAPAPTTGSLLGSNSPRYTGFCDEHGAIRLSFSAENDPARDDGGAE